MEASEGTTFETLSDEEADGTWVVVAAYVVAAYNEAEVIREVVEHLLGLGVHVVIVDDGSTDGTAARLHGLPVNLVRHPVNLGQGAATQTGMEFAVARGAHYLVTFDGDGQHDERDIPKLIHVLTRDGRDVALASRFLGKEATGITRSKKLLLRLAVRYTQFATGLQLSDAHNGFRAFRAEVAPALRITQNRMAHASEILQNIARAGLSYAEVPTVVRYTGYSKAKGQTGLGAIDILYDLFIGRFLQ
jgi:glycosyltransferase involved in cell wall biosynthesis